MSLAEIKEAVSKLSKAELAELATFIREQDVALSDREVDADFGEGGRLRSVVNELQRPTPDR